METNTWCIDNVCIATPEQVIENGRIRISGSKISEIDPSPRPTTCAPVLDGRGAWLLPGFVDLHADSLENAVAPRPSAPFAAETVLPTYDASLALHGITTVFHCVGLADLGPLTKPLRSREQALSLVDSLQAFLPKSLLRTYIHLRYEILDVGSLDSIQDLIAGGRIHLLSLMDHTPGFGVFQNVEAYREYHNRSGGSLKAADRDIATRLALRQQVDMDRVGGLISAAARNNIAVVSHDDHSEEKIDWAASHSISVAEFPVTMEAVEAARNQGMSTVFGAANLVRGESHAGNLRAADMVRGGYADIICSDYSPMCLLQGFFSMYRDSDLTVPELTALFSANPAQAAGMHDVGSIEEGKEADLILVREEDGSPKVQMTLVGGRQVYSCLNPYPS